MNKGIFITGTDTGVGKTYIASGIAAALRDLGVNVGVMKPAETGCSMQGGRLVARDAKRLIKAAHASDPIALVNPYRFRLPLAPSVAARLAGKKIEPDKIIAAYHELTRKHDFMIVEGAGGILVPLMGNYTCLDLARALGLPVLIVARPGLGTINHTLLTIAALKGEGMTISGVVVNHSQKQKIGLAERTSPSEIEKISGVKVLGVVGFESNRLNDIAELLDAGKR